MNTEAGALPLVKRCGPQLHANANSDSFVSCQFLTLRHHVYLSPNNSRIPAGGGGEGLRTEGEEEEEEEIPGGGDSHAR